MRQKFINLLYISFIIILISFSARSAEDLKSIGKFKDWETFTVTENNNKICFAQSIPILRAPKKFERNPSRLFISFRPSEDVKDEVSATSGYAFQKEKIVKAKTGRLLLVRKCKKSWCKIETGKYSGWVEIRNLWGSTK